MRRAALGLCALAALAGASLAAPATAFAQPVANAVPTQSTVAVLPFTGNATQDLIDDAEAVVRNALLTRGATVSERSAVMMALGVDAPRDARNVATFGRNLRATHVLSGTVRPLSGQYVLTLTITEAATARAATREENVGGDTASATIRSMLEQLFDPASLGPAPVDPEEERRRREAEERRAAEERQRAEQQRRDAEAQRRRAEEERQRAFEAANPLRPYAAGGPFAIGVQLHLGGLASDTRATPTMVRPGGQLTEPSSLAFMLRVEGAYALRAVSGLEVVAAAMLMTTPTTALGLGAGAQFTFPSTGRGRFRATGGAVIGLFQGLSGAQITTAWVAPYARAQFDITPTVAAVAGLALDVAPGDNGGVTTLTVTAGARFRLGN